MQINKGNGRSLYFKLLYKGCIIAVAMASCTKQPLAMKESSQAKNQKHEMGQGKAQLQIINDCGCNYFLLLSINSIMLLPSSRFSAIVPLMTKDEKDALRRVLKELADLFLIPVVSRISLKTSDIKGDAFIKLKNKIESKSQSLASKAVEDSEMTYGAFVWEKISAVKVALRKEIANLLRDGALRSLNSEWIEDSTSCKKCITKNKKKLHEIMSLLWQQGPISNRILMNSRDVLQKTWNMNGVTYEGYSFIIPSSYLVALDDALKMQSTQEVTKKYVKFLEDCMSSPVFYNNVSHLEEVLKPSSLGQAYDIDAICKEIGEIPSKQSNALRNPVKTKHKKRIPIKSQPLFINGKEDDSLAIAQAQPSSSNRLCLIDIATLLKNYCVADRVTKWSRNPNALLNHFETAKAGSYDAQYKYHNDTIDRVIKQKIIHDLIPINCLLSCADACNYFTYEEQDGRIVRNASVIVKNQDTEEFRMLDIVIGKEDNIIFHQALRRPKTVEETLRFPKDILIGNDYKNDNRAYLFEEDERSIHKDFTTQSYIVNITSKSNEKLTKTIHVLPYQKLNLSNR
ncbi:MAG: hypothetical protein NQ127_01190 [Candidatus Cardinium sp.]|nr:hypothetical protein [Candidatus Cardinium sp.]